jgi:Carbamoyl-phosphate synthase L chain, ATP binding domain
LKPTVLVVTTSRWFPTARLAVALANAGCRVEAVCPSGHPISKTTVLRRTFPYRGVAPLQSFAVAIRATTPDLLVSGDDLATLHLHGLHAEELRSEKSGSSFSQLIERSIGAPDYFPTIDDRASFMRIAEEEGVRIPQTAAIAHWDGLRKWIAEAGFPVVLKANGTSGGVGVRVVNGAEEAENALRRLQSPPLFLRAAKRAIFDRDTTLVWPSIRRTRSAVTAQSFIAGREATSAVACWKGQVLAGLHFEVLQKSAASGHATVLRRIEHPEMTLAAEKMVRRLQLSGLHGFDFMLDAQSRDAYLIEINPRATQVGHLSFGPGFDLPAALISVATGTSIVPAPKVTENDVIALFPQEWLRDPASTFLRSAYHDVPWQEPELLRASARKPGSHKLLNFAQRYTR